ncbi:hypothetical protein ACIRBZ_39510 [Streptomyces sp. NPDC094038]|uniref:hypothetical protein n=1 Tax=Streptomyces sp. NPDC094038 TaxID=3366055 RepID=UPI003811034F
MTREDETAAVSLPTPGTDNATLGDLLWEVAAYVELPGEAELADLPVTTASDHA